MHQNGIGVLGYRVLDRRDTVLKRIRRTLQRNECEVFDEKGFPIMDDRNDTLPIYGLFAVPAL